jgi:hypothetical protein
MRCIDTYRNLGAEIVCTLIISYQIHRLGATLLTAVHLNLPSASVSVRMRKRCAGSGGIRNLYQERWHLNQYI